MFYSLSEKALEYANRADGKSNYQQLKEERFDLRDEPVTARQKLHVVRQNDDEALEDFLQRVLTIAMDGFIAADDSIVQQLATEAFFRGCKHKEAAEIVINEAPRTIQEACRKVKTVLANRKAVLGGRVAFAEKQFTLSEEQRVSNIERRLDDLTKQLGRSSTPPLGQ